MERLERLSECTALHCSALGAPFRVQFCSATVASPTPSKKSSQRRRKLCTDAGVAHPTNSPRNSPRLQSLDKLQWVTVRLPRTVEKTAHFVRCWPHENTSPVFFGPTASADFVSATPKNKSCAVGQLDFGHKCPVSALSPPSPAPSQYCLLGTFHGGFSF